MRSDDQYVAELLWGGHGRGTINSHRKKMAHILAFMIMQVNLIRGHLGRQTGVAYEVGWIDKRKVGERGR